MLNREKYVENEVHSCTSRNANENKLIPYRYQNQI